MLERHRSGLHLGLVPTLQKSKASSTATSCVKKFPTHCGAPSHLLLKVSTLLFQIGLFVDIQENNAIGDHLHGAEHAQPRQTMRRPFCKMTDPGVTQHRHGPCVAGVGCTTEGASASRLLAHLLKTETNRLKAHAWSRWL
ncbi:unnamed protein product [Durusdinium trenchii]|uniref:Uncharacterized protein n=1 Tax=Durusdinium trenchii TaxID=1381693 RepID=A0ABP0R7I4_9DINO